MSSGDINFTFKVETCLEANEVKRLRDAELDDRFDVLNEIFSEDPNIWDAFYVAALEALGDRK